MTPKASGSDNGTKAKITEFRSDELPELCVLMAWYPPIQYKNIGHIKRP